MASKRKRHKRPPISVQLERTNTLSKGKAFRRIILHGSDDNREYSLHATKGYRSHTKID